MKNLVVGNTSQLFPYFKQYDENILGISSRNFNYNIIKHYTFDRAFLVFAEQRTFLDKPVEFFSKINVDYTLEIINQLKYNTKTIVVYLTCDMWDQCEGGVNIDTPFINRQTSYIKSKEILKIKIEELRQKENIDIKIIYPFNFNSPYRKPDFIFYKFMDVIINKNPIKIGNINFSRDIVHPKIIVQNSFTCSEDTVVGSGILTNLKDFYVNILNHFNIDYNEYITEESNLFINTRKPFYFETNNKYLTLIPDTIYDIEQYKNSIS
jgi:nucleoside-diphosphate-sugar epimerase